MNYRLIEIIFLLSVSLPAWRELAITRVCAARLTLRREGLHGRHFTA